MREVNEFKVKDRMAEAEQYVAQLEAITTKLEGFILEVIQYVCGHLLIVWKKNDVIECQE